MRFEIGKGRSMCSVNPLFFIDTTLVKANKIVYIIHCVMHIINLKIDYHDSPRGLSTISCICRRKIIFSVNLQIF